MGSKIGVSEHFIHFFLWKIKNFSLQGHTTVLVRLTGKFLNPWDPEPLDSFLNRRKKLYVLISFCLRCLNIKLRAIYLAIQHKIYLNMTTFTGILYTFKNNIGFTVWIWITLTTIYFTNLWHLHNVSTVLLTKHKMFK